VLADPPHAPGVAAAPAHPARELLNHVAMLTCCP